MKIKSLLSLCISTIFIQSCWLKNIRPNSPEIKQINFETNYSTNFKNGKISKNDTLWFELSPKTEQIDTKTKQSYQLQNASFAFSARLRSVKQIDLKAFTNNFQIVMKKGRLQNISYSNFDESMIDFDMRFGCPNENKLIFGMIFKEKGIYNFTASGNVFLVKTVQIAMILLIKIKLGTSLFAL